MTEAKWEQLSLFTDKELGITSSKASITVYTNPNCVQCDQTKRYLDSHNVLYETIDLSQNKEALEMVLNMGYKSAPVIITENDSWSGFRLSKLHGLMQSKHE